MKRGSLILLFICLLAFSVSAMTVTLVSPAHGAVSTDVDSVSLTCSGTITPGPGEEFDNLTLYFKNNESVDWHAEETVSGIESGANKVFSVTSLVNATYTWNCLAVSNNSEETWAGSNRTFIITFTEAPPPAPNNAPSCTIAAGTNKSIDEDTGTDIDSDMSVSGGIECTDDDSDPLTYAIYTQSGTGTFSITGSNISAYSDANATGEGYATLSVTDNTDTVYFDINVSWNAVNDAPYLSAIITNQTWSKDTTKTIDLDGHFSDVDDTSLTYNYTFTSTGTIDINVTIESDGDAVFTPDDDWTGTEKLTFTAYDSQNASATSNEVILTVQESNETTNTAPNIDTYLPETNPAISVNKAQTFSITKSDADGDPMNVTWYVDNVIQEGKTGDSFTYTASAVGSFVIKVAVSDGQASDTTSWTLTVKTAETTPTTTLPEEKKPGETTSVCGDGVCDEDESKVSCCKDCGCPEGFTCDVEKNRCTREKKSRNIILLVIIISVFMIGAGVGLYLYKKKQEKEIFGLAAAPFKVPPKEGEVKVKKEEVKVKEPVKEAAKEPLKKAKTTSQVLLKKYILYNLKKGKSFEQIKKELLKVGWTEGQIDDAYTAAQLDEAFS